MAPFFPLYLRRSDGRVEIKTKTTKEPNEPTETQLNTKPNAQGISDFYRQCPQGDAKEIDWRRKLGGMLIREIGNKELQDRNYILATLPENYRLYEHVKCRFSDIDGKPQKVTKNHAAGANERQDAYLYGHPSGRKKRYRSPAEFFPHLLWLATDEAGDTNNCSCKFCSPEEVESEEKPPTKIIVKDLKQEVPNSVPTSASIPGRRISQQSVQTSQLPGPQATPLPRHRSTEQRQDAQYNQFLYRPGEVVWFSRGQAWGLGALVQRDAVQTHTGAKYQYSVQPLSHPIRHPQIVSCQQDQLRPWLAWSPPPCTCALLNPSPNNNNRVFTFETVDWQSFVDGRYGAGDPEVDGSILSAKAIETTFTLFDRIDSKTSTSGSSQTSEIYYNGMYLGGEKIWVGEPLRLRNHNSPSDIMILHAIVERPHLETPTRPQITLIGDSYMLQPASPTATAAPHTDANLPLRVREDIRVRNGITISNPDASKRTWFWQLQAKSVRMGIADVKGRWYESSIFVPIMDAVAYATNRQNGDIADAGLWMNGQGDCNRPPGGPLRSFKPADIKTRRREDAFGKSVPVGFTISKGLDAVKSEVPDTARDVKMEDRASTPLQLRARETTPLQPPHNQIGQVDLQITQQAFASNVQSGSPYVSIPPLTDGNFDQYMKFDDDDPENDHGAGLSGFAEEFGAQDLEPQYFDHDSMQH